MGREHAVDSVTRDGAALPEYPRLEGENGAVVRHAPHLPLLGREVLAHLETGLAALPEMLGISAPALEALVVAGDDWDAAPRDNSRPYPRGLPYFTRATEPPALVIPERLSGAIQPRTGATLPLVVHHELAHAFLAGVVAVRIPSWLRELPPQAASAAVARREALPLDEHLTRMESPGFTIRGFHTPAAAGEQMAFQNLLLRLGAAALAGFGEAFLPRLVAALRRETELDESRAEDLLAEALGPGGREWLDSQEEF
ncbi:hypothetical protein [Rubrobacter aplysinae]|uniref:hypothetical protein n=1 Tax=Rubrobacter aplysinae TaxID=909625 RepID=UPI00064BE59B|nr:hypothetical protein [Rubrobacter aplysinae]